MQEHSYAEALKRLVESGKTPKQAVKAIHQVLVTRGQASLLPRIGRAFARIAAIQRAREVVSLYVAHESDTRKATKAAAEFLGSEKPEVHVDESLIGGWRLEGKGLLVDASFKKHLLQIYNQATST